MSNMNSVPCELCYSNIVRGIVHKIGSSYVCDDCKQELEKSEGVWFDGHAAEQSVQPTVLCTCFKNHNGTIERPAQNCPIHNPHSG